MESEQQAPGPAPSQPRAEAESCRRASVRGRAHISQIGRTAVSIKRSVANSSTGGRRKRLTQSGRAPREFDEQLALKILQDPRRSRRAAARRPPSPHGTRRAPSWSVRRRSVDCRSQSPSIAAVDPSRCASTSATPAQRDSASIRSNARVGLVVRNRRNRRFGLLGDRGDQVGRRRDPIADEEDHRTGLESAQRLADVADREHADAIQAKPLECVLQRLRDSLDHDDDRGRAGSGGASHLIFDERAAGEREQRAQAAAVVFLIGSDQRADRHAFLLFLPRLAAILSNRFPAPSKMVNCRLR